VSLLLGLLAVSVVGSCGDDADGASDGPGADRDGGDAWLADAAMESGAVAAMDGSAGDAAVPEADAAAPGDGPTDAAPVRDGAGDGAPAACAPPPVALTTGDYPPDVVDAVAAAHYIVLGTVRDRTPSPNLSNIDVERLLAVPTWPSLAELPAAGTSILYQPGQAGPGEGFRGFLSLGASGPAAEGYYFDNELTHPPLRLEATRAPRFTEDLPRIQTFLRRRALHARLDGATAVAAAEIVTATRNPSRHCTNPGFTATVRITGRLCGPDLPATLDVAGADQNLCNQPPAPWQDIPSGSVVLILTTEPGDAGAPRYILRDRRDVRPISELPDVDEILVNGVRLAL
jgi:hypothetical protein